jgi:hypothetical protein
MASAGPCWHCGADQWQDLPNPHPLYTLRTDGGQLTGTLQKSSCLGCGLVQRFDDSSALTTLYERE